MREYRLELRRSFVSVACARCRLRRQIPDSHAPLKRTVADHVFRLARLEVWKKPIARRLDDGLFYLTGMLGFLGLVAAFAAASWTNFLQVSGGDVASALFISVIGVFAGLLVLAAPLAIAKSATRSLISPRTYTFTAIFLGAMFIAIGVRILLQPPPLQLSHFTWAVILLGSTTLALLLPLSGVIARMVEAIVEGRAAAVAPDSIVIVHLLEARRVAAEAWRENADVRRRLLEALDVVSRTFRRDFPLVYRSGDLVADAAAAKHYIAVAEGIRSLKKLVLVPRTNSADVLREKTLTAAIAMLDGAWDALPRQDPVREPRGMIGSVASFVRAIVLAVLPAIFLIAAAKYGYELPRDTKPVVQIAAAVWAFVGLMMAIDPQFATKITTTKDFITLAFGKRDK